MTDTTGRATSRRRFLTTTGTAVALIPLVNLVGCADNGEGETEPTVDPTTEPTTAPEAPGGQPAAGASQQSTAPAAGDMAGEGASQAAGQSASQPAGAGQTAGGDMAKLELSDPQAQALGYVHDATQVDSGQYPTYQSGQLCSNCQLYLPDAGVEEGWGGCSIFPGKLVNADGWCSAYVAAS